MPLFDTTFIIDLARNEPGALRIAERTSTEGGVPAISVISLHEYLAGVHLRFGGKAKDLLAGKLAAAQAQMDNFEVIPLTAAVARTSASLQVELSRMGTPIALSDLFVAATAIARDLTLVTRDKGFDRVPRLKVEDY